MSELIVSGPSCPFLDFQGSLAEFLMESLRFRPQDELFQVHVDTEEVVTMGGMLTMSIEIAAGFKDLGLQQGDIVAIAGHNSNQLHATALGVLWAGGIFAALGPDMKQREMEALFKDIKPKFIVIQGHNTETAEQALKSTGIDADVLVVDVKSGESKFRRIEDIRRKVDINTFKPASVSNPSSSLALILCSSGTTGLPKCVGLTHTGIIFQLQSWQYQPLMHGKTFLQTSPFNWISGVLFLFFSCCMTFHRYFLNAVNVENIMRAIEKYKPRLALLLVNDLQAILRHPDRKKYDLSYLKELLSGGVSLSKALAEEAKETLHVKMCQTYGMTEVSGVMTISDFNIDVEAVGRLGYGVELKVEDLKDRQTLGPHQVGELVLKCKGVMLGYIGNEEGTKMAIKNGWYYSGDLGYYDENKSIFIVDRIKEIIKYRAHQISPAEIEGFISTLNGVLDSGVVGVPHPDDGYHPMAFVVKTKGSTLTEDDIIQAVEKNLSNHKQLRAGVRFVDSLPRTGTGKMKRTALKEMMLART